jgi:hypothetical protein
MDKTAHVACRAYSSLPDSSSMFYCMAITQQALAQLNESLTSLAQQRLAGGSLKVINAEPPAGLRAYLHDDTPPVAEDDEDSWYDGTWLAMTEGARHMMEHAVGHQPKGADVTLQAFPKDLDFNLVADVDVKNVGVETLTSPVFSLEVLRDQMVGS